MEGGTRNLMISQRHFQHAFLSKFRFGHNHLVKSSLQNPPVPYRTVRIMYIMLNEVLC